MGAIATTWRKRGFYKLLRGHRVFYIDHNPEATETLVILHGFPTSSMDYYKVLDALGERYRVIVHDHIGFGYSDKPVNYSYSLKDQADIALDLWRELKLDKVHLLAHDYGTSIATEILARRQEETCDLDITKLYLNNGSMLVDMARMRPIQKLLINPLTGWLVAKLTTKKIFSKNIKAIYNDSSRVSYVELSDMWRLLLENKGRRVLPKIGRYNVERKKYYKRWIGALENTDIPTHIVWAENDPIAILPMAHKLDEIITKSTLTTLLETGHFPMLERPEEWVKAILTNNK